MGDAEQAGGPQGSLGYRGVMALEMKRACFASDLSQFILRVKSRPQEVLILLPQIDQESGKDSHTLEVTLGRRAWSHHLQTVQLRHPQLSRGRKAAATSLSLEPAVGRPGHRAMTADRPFALPVHHRGSFGDVVNSSPSALATLRASFSGG